MPVEELDAIIKAELAAKTRASDGPITGKPVLWTGPFELTKPAGPSRLSPRESVAEIALGDGWGCAELDAHGERQRVCWLTSSVAERDRGKRALHAERVPWLGVWPAATATGQAIVATGRLEWDTRGDAGWMLSEPRLCSLQ